MLRPPFTHETIEAVWQKADEVPGVNPDIWRKDFAGAWIRRDYIGVRNLYGWSIDHCKPLSVGGTNAPENLMPMHWRNKDCRNGGYPVFQSILTSDGNHNKETAKAWRFKG